MIQIPVTTTTNDQDIVKISFQYRIEGGGRESVGGIWNSSKNYSFVCTNNSQINVHLLEKFGDWTNSNNRAIANRMPWLRDPPALLTTDDNGLTPWWGTLIATNWPKYGTGPLVKSSGEMMHKVYYWMRENVTGISLSLSLWTNE